MFNALRNLGNKSLYSNARRAAANAMLGLGASQSVCVANNINNNYKIPGVQPLFLVGSTSTAGYDNGGGHGFKAKEVERRIPVIDQDLDYYVHLKGRGLEAARFATQEFNKQKNAQLQFVRMLFADRRMIGDCFMYFLLLEAMDDGVLKVYQAHVSPNFTGGMLLQFFGLVVDKGPPLKLFDPLDDFWEF